MLPLHEILHFILFITLFMFDINTPNDFSYLLFTLEKYNISISRKTKQNKT